MREKKTWVQLANKRTLEIKLWEDGSLSIAQVQDGDYIKVPEAYVSDFMDALQTITADAVQQQPSLNAVLNTTNMASAVGGSMHPRCNTCGVIRSGQTPWYSCDDCGVLTCEVGCWGGHESKYGVGHNKWSIFQ